MRLNNKDDALIDAIRFDFQQDRVGAAKDIEPEDLDAFFSVIDQLLAQIAELEGQNIADRVNEGIQRDVERYRQEEER